MPSAILNLTSPQFLLKDGHHRLHLAFNAATKLSIPHEGFLKDEAWKSLVVLTPASGFKVSCFFLGRPDTS